MLKMLLTGIAALFLATGAAHADCASYSGMKLQQCIAKELIELPIPPKFRRETPKTPTPPYTKGTDEVVVVEMPPPEFDHAFQGTVEIRESADPCGDGDLFKMGCTTYIQREPYPLCHIEMAKRRIIEAMGEKYDDVLRRDCPDHC